MKIMDSINFHSYIMDRKKYLLNIHVLDEQLNYLREVNDSMELTPNQLDEKIKANQNCVAKLTNEIVDKQCELLKLKNELYSLQCDEMKSKDVKNVLHLAIDTSHKEPIKESAYEFQYAANVLEARLGFKLKLTPCEPNGNHNLWLAKFIFDAFTNATESRKYVVLRVDVTDSSFRLVDMKPMPARFREMTQLLADTNDVAGFLATSYRYFNSR